MNRLYICSGRGICNSSNCDGLIPHRLDIWGVTAEQAKTYRVECGSASHMRVGPMPYFNIDIADELFKLEV